MPSSSTGITAQEWALCTHFKTAYARLFFENMSHEAQTVLGIYREMLDCSDKALVNALRGDGKWWVEMKMAALKCTRSANVYVAAECLVNTAATLRQYGRMPEAEKLAEWIRELYEIAAVEQAYERGG